METTVSQAAMKPILGAAFQIPKELLEDWEMDEIRCDLTFTPKQGRSNMGFSSNQRPILAYDDRGDWIIVPRNYGLDATHRFSGLAGVEIIDRTSVGDPVDFMFNETLQSEKPVLKAAQDRMVDKVVKAFAKGNLGGVVCAPCGTGKTVVGLKIAAQLGRTTLVLVHKEFLMNQWAERVEQWLGIPKDEVGIVQQDQCDYAGKKIVLAMVQSLCVREYDPGLYKYAGLVLTDEVHRHSAELWHKSIMQFSSKYRLGLTATPDRSDGMWPVIVENFGGILAQEEGEAMSPTIYVVRYSPNIPLGAYCWMSYGGMRVRKSFLARFLNALVQHVGRNELIVQIVAKAVREDRKVMLLTDRRGHIDGLQPEIIAASDGATVGQYVGGMSNKGRAISEQCQVILATYQMAAEALDIPDIDVLVLATPHANVEQAVGRVCRHRPDKKAPIVVDIADDEPYICEPFFQKRLSLFYKKGWPVRYI